MSMKAKLARGKFGLILTKMELLNGNLPVRGMEILAIRITSTMETIGMFLVSVLEHHLAQESCSHLLQQFCHPI